MVGSANINQRSLGGSRDSELCICGHQPGHLGAVAEGAVHTFRLALWAAHLGRHREESRRPASRQCAAMVKEVTEASWVNYTAEKPRSSAVHLLPYPVLVTKDGQVTTANIRARTTPLLFAGDGPGRPLARVPRHRGQRAGGQEWLPTG